MKKKGKKRSLHSAFFFHVEHFPEDISHFVEVHLTHKYSFTFKSINRNFVISPQHEMTLCLMKKGCVAILIQRFKNFKGCKEISWDLLSRRRGINCCGSVERTQLPCSAFTFYHIPPFSSLPKTIL